MATPSSDAERQTMLATYRRRLRHALDQQRVLGVYTPFHITEDVRVCRVAITDLQTALGDAFVAAAEDTPTAAEQISWSVPPAGQQITGDYNVQASDGSTVYYTVNQYGTAVPDPARDLRIARALLDAIPTDVVPVVANLPSGSRMPLSPNPFFVGREADLQALADALKVGTTTVIAAATGMGGLGKTQLAAEFAHHYGQFFAGGVFWLSFADASGMDAEIAACGVAMNLPSFDALDLPTQVARVRQKWQEPTPRLLVFDNCEDEALLKAY